MQWFLWGLAVVVVGLAALVAAGRFGGMPATAVHDSPIPEFPTDRDLDGADLRRVRFAIATRGYSMAQVDDLLDRLAVQLGDQGAAAGGAPEADPVPAEQDGAAERDDAAETGRDGAAPEPAEVDAPVADAAPQGGWRGFSTLRAAAKSVASPSESAGSAIMEPDVSQQPREEGEHGSNEAPHG